MTATATFDRAAHALRVRAHDHAIDHACEIAELDAAIAAFDALELVPTCAAGFYNLGLALWAAGDLAGATEAFDGALRVGYPDDERQADVHYNVGRMAYARGDLDAARTAFEEASNLGMWADPLVEGVDHVLTITGDRGGDGEPDRFPYRVYGCGTRAPRQDDMRYRLHFRTAPDGDAGPWLDVEPALFVPRPAPGAAFPPPAPDEA